MRPLIGLLAAALPGALRSHLVRLIGWEIHPSATLGLAWVNCGRLSMGPGSAIGHLTVIRGPYQVELGEGASIGVGNRISAGSGSGTLRLGRGAAIVSHHYVDAAEDVDLGEWATLAGRDSQIWTHQWSDDGDRRRLVRAGVRLGDGVYAGARCLLLPGVEIPAGTTVGAGAVVGRAAAAECDGRGSRLVGNPAEAQTRATR